MLVWRTLKRYEETGNIQNKPGQGRSRTARTPKLVKSTREKIRRNPKRSIQNLTKESNVSYETMSTVVFFFGRTQRCPLQACQETPTFCQFVDKRLQRGKILHSRIQDDTVPNLVFSDEKKLNTTLTPILQSEMQRWDVFLTT